MAPKGKGVQSLLKACKKVPVKKVKKVPQVGTKVKVGDTMEAIEKAENKKNNDKEVPNIKACTLNQVQKNASIKNGGGAKKTEHHWARIVLFDGHKEYGTAPKTFWLILNVAAVHFVTQSTIMLTPLNPPLFVQPVTPNIPTSSSKKQNLGDIKELLPDGYILQVYRHHEAESYHHHHEAGLHHHNHHDMKHKKAGSFLSPWPMGGSSCCCVHSYCKIIDQMERNVCKE
ncbi:hypothetical protein C8R48DRAFT_674032 [Suillus tomentosus]|nr:hypothetical protein C8R48DRAFT_674032 [Suillus tomentosus]